MDDTTSPLPITEITMEKSAAQMLHTASAVSFGTTLVQWKEREDLDVQARIDLLRELKWSIQKLQLHDIFDQLLHSIEDGTVYSGTDDSCKDGYGTATFRIQKDQGNKLTGYNITPGLQEY
jgi:hypothetical protein